MIDISKLDKKNEFSSDPILEVATRNSKLSSNTQPLPSTKSDLNKVSVADSEPHYDFNEIFQGFSKLNLRERLTKLKMAGLLDEQKISYLTQGGLRDTQLGEKFIENVIGYFQIPLGVATNFRIDGKDYMIPMAVEETSIVAAASKTAKWIRESGKITTEVIGTEIIGQIQIAKVKDFARFEALMRNNADNFIAQANRDVAAGMVKRGGGVTRLECRHLVRPDGLSMAVVHVLANSVDAMGANIINQVCEYLREPIESLTGEKVSMCILSNLVDTKLTRAKIEIENIDAELGEKIEEASIFAETDPYRAATNNKGVLNGMDPILIATGNDWRAVEAGVHAYASRSGQYRSITQWRYKSGKLTGTIEAPIVVGTVGGVTALHPTAKLCLEMLGIHSSNDLSRIVAAVGLTQNLGALKALTTVGIIEGHMRLHLKNMSLGAGAEEREIPALIKKLEEFLKEKKRITQTNVVDILTDFRSKMKNKKQSNLNALEQNC